MVDKKEKPVEGKKPETVKIVETPKAEVPPYMFRKPQ